MQQADNFIKYTPCVDLFWIVMLSIRYQFYLHCRLLNQNRKTPVSEFIEKKSGGAIYWENIVKALLCFKSYDFNSLNLNQKNRRLSRFDLE